MGIPARIVFRKCHSIAYCPQSGYSGRMNTTDKTTLLITCARGLSEMLRAEVEALGFTVQASHDTGVELAGDMADAMRLNLHLRTAFNVLYLLAEFPCRTPDQLYREVSKLPWEDIIPSNEYLCVVGRIDTPSIDNTMYPNLKIKDAIVDRILKKTGARPDSGKERTHVVVQAYWKGDRCWLSKYLKRFPTATTASCPSPPRCVSRWPRPLYSRRAMTARSRWSARCAAVGRWPSRRP